MFKSPKDSRLFEGKKIGWKLDYDPIGLDKNSFKCFNEFVQIQGYYYK